MSRPYKNPPVFFFISFLYRQDSWDKETLKALGSDLIGEGLLKEHSFFPMKEYYSKEMGPEDKLGRVFYLGTELKQREEIKDAKLLANGFEDKYLMKDMRTVNIDPGYLALEQLGLSTMKPYNHRIYLGSSVYIDLQLLVKAQKFVDLPWSYPDYSHPEIKQFFWTHREKLKKSMT